MILLRKMEWIGGWMLLTREVPWDDLADDTDGFMASVSELVLISLDRLSLDLIGPTGIIANCTDRSSNIDILGPAESFTYNTHCELHGKKLRMLDHDIPLSKASSAASSSMCASIISASLLRYLDRRVPETFRPHTVSNAFCAALTATSTSFGVAEATLVIIFPSAVEYRDQLGPCAMNVTTHWGSQYYKVIARVNLSLNGPSGVIAYSMVLPSDPSWN